MNLMTFLFGTGYHLAGWRHPDAWDTSAMRFDVLLETATIAEQAKLDAVFVADGNAVRNMQNPILFEAVTPSDRPSVFEPATLMSAIAQHTTHVGLVSTATTTYDEPYFVARRFASLDHLSGGRAGWNVVTGSYPGDSVNFGLEEHMPREIRYPRAMEFVEACKELWDSWAPDAFIQDKSTGRYLDSTRVRTADFRGEHIKVMGPLNVTRCPQGYPVLFHAGQSEAGRELGAKHADCIFASSGSLDICQRFYSDMKERRERHGRPAESLRILPAAAIYLGNTEAEADELLEELNSLIVPELGVAQLSKVVSEDLSPYPVDGPLPDLSAQVIGGTSMRQHLAEIATRENLTIRQMYERVVPGLGESIFKGDAIQVADQMEEWYTSGACDGFVLGAAVNPRVLLLVRDQLVPELQRRGLFRKEYSGSTLRENMGLETPANPYFVPVDAG